MGARHRLIRYKRWRFKGRAAGLTRWRGAMRFGTGKTYTQFTRLGIGDEWPAPVSAAQLSGPGDCAANAERARIP
jgi:hypothetical protein